GRELADGLAAAHAKKVVHRDVKPGNVWLEGDPSADDPAERFRRVKILDFGLVARANEGADVRMTGAGEVLGTPAYMSPEQAAGMPVDEKTDIFSLGVILYELVTGKQPFEGTSVVSSLVNVATAVPPKRPAVDESTPWSDSGLPVAVPGPGHGESIGVAASEHTGVLEAGVDTKRGVGGPRTVGTGPQRAAARTVPTASYPPGRPA